MHASMAAQEVRNHLEIAELEVQRALLAISRLKPTPYNAQHYLKDAMDKMNYAEDELHVWVAEMARRAEDNDAFFRAHHD